MNGSQRWPSPPPRRPAAAARAHVGPAGAPRLHVGRRRLSPHLHSGLRWLSPHLCGSRASMQSVVVLVLLSLSLLGLLSGTSVLLVRRSAATGHEEARGCSSSMVPTVDGLLSRISCSLLFGVRSSFWMAADGGWLLWCASLRSEDRRLPVSTKKKNSSGWLALVVILCFIRVLSTRKGCTMLTFI